jgi:uncharacterized repeat protein (TIGR03803 family)
MNVTLMPSWRVPTIALVFVVAFVLAVVASPPAQAQTYNVIYNFTGGLDGATPYAGVVIDRAGRLYGTTYSGGASGSYGAVYQLKKSGVFDPLYDFAGGNDGAHPTANVVIAPNGILYGTTYAGGGSGCGGSGCGTVFSLRPPATAPRSAVYPWTEMVLYRFTGGADGEHPTGTLIFGADGNIYGTTYGDPTVPTRGTVFKITTSGALTTLYTFCSLPNCVDGANPYAGLVQGTDLNFYGTTELGGQSDLCGGYDSEPGCGTVFRITASGALTTLYSFCSQGDCADGELPVAALIQGTDGNFYGTTETGTPTIPNHGTAFKITPSGFLTTLYSFCSLPNCTGGRDIIAGLFQASDGNLYGATHLGGMYDRGSLYKLTGDTLMTLVTLYSFCPQNGCSDGQQPLASPVQDPTTGNFYGTASAGGKYGDGVVWELTP